jgi:glycosyltransferase involved in cell wall biosynthesis
VDIIPNGVYPGVERIDQERHLERGEVTIGYFGYLAGAWFDWKLLEEVAQRQPSWRIYLIGYGGESKGLSLPGNICILGKKPRHQLASFAAQWDVAIVPFKPERLAAGADPIKTYEYLAMGLPVVVTGVFPPEGAERFVTRARGTDEFMEKVRQASAIGASERLQCVQFAKKCTWGKRLDSMLSVIRAGAQRVGEKRSLFEESR